MTLHDIEAVWLKSNLLRASFEEYRACLTGIYKEARSLLAPHPDLAPEFQVELGEVPPAFFTFPRNIFSTLFQSMYRLLEITEARRLLYGRINHLFRIWVTSADNLLDDEDKIVLPLRLAGKSRVMHQVIAIMAADRILHRLLAEAAAGGVISPAQADKLSDKSLHVLLPSAAEEASEEGGITHRPDPEYVLFTIHRLKTGMLFQVPFLGPQNTEDGIDPDRLVACREALAKFGLGCQLLDDIRDLAKDLHEGRHNYLLSQIEYEKRTADTAMLERLRPEVSPSAKMYSHFPEIVEAAARRGRGLLEEGLRDLCTVGLDADESSIRAMAKSMFQVLDVEDTVA